MTVKVRIKEQKQVKKFFKSLGVDSEKAIDNVLRNVADMIQTRAIRNLDKGFKGPDGEDGGAVDDGNLKNGFQIKDEPLRKVVGNNVNYAAHMEFGTGPGAGKEKYMPPSEEGSPLEGWSAKKGYDAGGVAQTIYNRGTKPRRYLGRAFHEKKQHVPFQFAKMLAKEIENSIGKKVAVKKR
tara:strand:+ start:441 stop:983 length:543 start_codon:yes stop_codon:yes gene_type:complete